MAGKKRSKTEVRRPKEKKLKAKKPAAKKKAAKKFVAPTTVPKSAPYSEGKWAEAFEPRKAGEKRYWLVKSEPSVFSFDDLLRAPNCTTCWDGVRNFAARNFLRDGMRLGDRVFYYHSMAEPQHIAGIAEVVRESYPDFTALDPNHEHFDPESNPNAPTWFMVDVRAVAQFTKPVTLPEMKARKELENMALLRIGRLSVTPVRAKEWETIVGMAR
jgi:predicted RNA-binding protein with PUA-like domain